MRMPCEEERRKVLGILKPLAALLSPPSLNERGGGGIEELHCPSAPSLSLWHMKKVQVTS